MQHQNWQCLKCGYSEYDTGEFRATGGAFAKIFDVQNRKFSTVTCTQCSYTEIYKSDTSTLGNVFDFFTN
jgi:predicted nucleic-acid-binding Zn-ribbon protein